LCSIKDRKRIETFAKRGLSINDGGSEALHFPEKKNIKKFSELGKTGKE
jgi:hypothetical protein